MLPGLKFNVELFARELAALLDAGVSVIDALRTLGSNERHRSDRKRQDNNTVCNPDRNQRWP
jgi:general secretion pathway protein F